MQVAIWYKDECAVRAVEIMRFRDFVERETARNVDLAALCELYSQVFLSAYPDRGDLLDSALLTFSSEVFAPQLCPSNPPGYSDLFYPVSAEDADPMQHDTMECVLVNDAVMCERIWVCGARDGGRTGFVGIAISEGHLDASRYVALAAVVCRSDVVDELRFDEGYMLRHFCRELSVFETERDDLCELACSFWAQVPGSLQAQAVAFPVFFDWFSGAFLQGVERSLLPSLFALLPRFLTRDGVSVMLDTWRKFFACFWRGSEGQAFVVGEWLFLADEFGGFVSANESEKAFSSSTERQCLVRYSESLGDYGCLVFSWSLPREKSPKIVNKHNMIA